MIFVSETVEHVNGKLRGELSTGECWEEPGTPQRVLHRLWVCRAERRGRSRHYSTVKICSTVHIIDTDGSRAQ